MNHLNPRSTDGRGMPVSPVDSQIGNHLNQQPTYSMSGILKYLQAEWARFELERANWFITKAEYEAKIATLQGREKGHNTLVNDCIRRIKMLEFSLKQERQRYYAKKTGIEIDLDLLDRSQSDQEPDDQNANNNDSQNDDNENENNEEKKDSSDLNDSKENNENIDSDVSGDGKTDNKDEGLGDSGESKKKKKSSKKNKKQKKTKNNNSNVATNEQIENNKTSDNTNENDNNLNDNNDKEKQINVNGNIPKQSEFFWRHGRQLLRQYLNEVGYTDAILDVRAKRLRALLKKNEIIWSENENQEVGNDKLKDVGKDVSPDGVGAESNNNNNSINNNNESAANNNNMVDAPLENLKTMLTQNPGNLQQNSIEANQILQDNIRQLKLDQERRGNLRTNNKSSPSDIEENMKNINEQVAAKEPHFKALFNELADQLSKPVLPDVSDRDLEGHNLEDGDRNNEGQNRSWWGNQRGSEGHVEGDVSRLGELAHIRIGKNDEVDPYGITKDLNKPDAKPLDQFSANRSINGLYVQNSLNLDDNVYAIDSINTNNRNSNLSDTNNQNQHNLFVQKFNLKGHYETVRDFTFHPTENVILSGSDDGTVKMWNLIGKKESVANSRSDANESIEPIYCHRMFDAPVLCTEFTQGGYNSKSLTETCSFAGAANGKLFTFNTPSFSSDMVSKYNPGMSIYCELVGHNDAIWSLNWNSQNNRLATASADGSVNIWHPALAEEYYSRADELTIDKENNQSKTFEQGKYFNLSPKFQSEDEENYLDTNRNRSDLENDDEAQITDEHEADRWMRWPQIKPISIIKESNAGKVDWGKNDLYITPNRCAWLNDHILVVAYSNGYIKLYDVSTEQTIQEIKPNQGSKVIQTYSHLNDDMTPKPRDLINDISVNEQLKVIGAAYWKVF